MSRSHKHKDPLENKTIGNTYGNRIYALAVIVSIGFLVCGLLFVRYAGNLSRDETIGYIQTATQQIKFSIEESIGDDFNLLLAAGVIARDGGMLEDPAALGKLGMGLGAANPFLTIGYAGADGRAVWIDPYNTRHEEDFSGEGFFNRALAGENALSRVRYDNASAPAVHFYAVPVYGEDMGEVEGVLFGAVLQDNLRNVIEHSLYAGQGLAHVIDSNGDYVVESDSALSVGTGNNIFHVPNPVSEETKQEILGDFAARRPGHLERSVFGQNRLIAYAPLDINDWYVFYAVPEDLVSAGLKNVTAGTAVVVSIATGIFILFILLIHQVNSKNRKVLEELAFVDSVTRQRNYQKFAIDAEAILEHANGAHYALCYSDIKGFKYINDLFGRDVGDHLLRYWANIQETVSQEGEISARISADAFVSLRRYQLPQDIAQRFESCAQQLAIFPEIFSRGYKVELYGGAYLIDPADGKLSLNDMLGRAIAAQKEGKLAGGTNRFRLFSNEMREQKLWETEVESAMEAALENNEFQVYLQPKIDIQHGNRVLGAEALVRWESPARGLISPERFIGLFETNGFILKLDRFVFETVCRYYRETILDQGLPAYILSVNVSRLALEQPDFVRSYAATRERYGIPDGRIELEFTESLAFGDHALFQTVVAECRRNGFLSSMDDFGSGYSSLNILKSIHVDILKLDRQFFRYEGDVERGQALVKNIIEMAKSMGMKTIAEGIEEEAQVEYLRTIGCDAIQGYVFSKPLPLRDFRSFGESWTGR